MFQRFPGSFRKLLHRTEPNDTTTNAATPPIPETRLRVAIPIAMPSPRGTVSTDPSTSDEGFLSKKGRLEYSIGLLEIPWKMDEG
jgi:hypothetical protein